MYGVRFARALARESKNRGVKTLGGGHNPHRRNAGPTSSRSYLSIQIRLMRMDEVLRAGTGDEGASPSSANTSRGGVKQHSGKKVLSRLCSQLSNT